MTTAVRYCDECHDVLADDGTCSVHDILPADPVAMVRALIVEHAATMAHEVAVKPSVTDGHSDGRRVRYARSETAVAVLTDVLAMLEGER